MPHRFDLRTAMAVVLFAGAVVFVWLRAALSGWVPEHAEAMICPDLAIAGEGVAALAEGVQGWRSRMSASVVSGLIFHLAGFGSGGTFLFLFGLRLVATALVVALARALGFSHRLSLLAGLLFFAPMVALHTFAFRYLIETLTLIAFLGLCLGFLRRRLATSRSRALAWGALEVFSLLLGLFSKETFPACFGLVLVAELTVVRTRSSEPFALRRSLRCLAPHVLAFGLIVWLQRDTVHHLLQLEEHYALTFNPLAIAANVHRLVTPSMLTHLPYYFLQGVVTIALLRRVRGVGGFLLAAPLLAALPMALFEDRYSLVYSYLPWAFVSVAVAGAFRGLQGRLGTVLVGVVVLAVFSSTYPPGRMEHEAERAADCYRTILWGLAAEGDDVCEPQHLPPSFRRRPGASAAPLAAPLWYVPRGVWEQEGCSHRTPRRLGEFSYLTTRSMDDGCFFAYVVALWCDTKVARAVLE